MIGDEHDNRVIEHSGAFEHVENATHLVVDVREIGKIPLARAADILGLYVELGIVVGIEDTLRVSILLVVGNLAYLGLEMLAVIVEIPVLASRYIRVVRVGETYA